MVKGAKQWEKQKSEASFKYKELPLKTLLGTVNVYQIVTPFTHTLYLQNPFCDNLKKKKFLKIHLLCLIGETGFRAFSARQTDPRKNENLDEMKDLVALNCH